MQNENLAKNSHKQFDAVLNTNPIKIYTYPDVLKENPLLRKFVNSESTVYFLDETFYHTHIYIYIYIYIYHFSQQQFPLQQSLKPQNIGRIASSITAMTQQLNIQSSALKNVKFSYLVGSVDKNSIYLHMTCLLPKY